MTGHYSCWIPESINFKAVGPEGSMRPEGIFTIHTTCTTSCIFSSLHDRIATREPMPIFIYLLLRQMAARHIQNSNIHIHSYTKI